MLGRVSAVLPASSAPPHRTGHTATLVHDELVIFGGMCEGECTADLVILHAVTSEWREIQPLGSETPRPRLGHAACAIEPASQLWLFGGGDGRLLLGDVWTLDRDADELSWRWESRSCAGKATGRMGHSLVHMPNNTLISFGGFVKGVKGGYSTQVLLLDMHTLTWSEPQIRPRPEGAPALRGRLGHVACVLGGGEAILILGGSAGGELLDEVLLLRTPADSGSLSLELIQTTKDDDAMARPRAHGAVVHVPPYVLHFGGARSDDQPVLDALVCPPSLEPGHTWQWTRVPMDGQMSGTPLLLPSRHKHAAVLKSACPQGAVALLWGGDEKSAGEADLAASRARCAQLVRIDLSLAAGRSPLRITVPASAVAPDLSSDGTSIMTDPPIEPAPPAAPSPGAPPAPAQPAVTPRKVAESKSPLVRSKSPGHTPVGAAATRIGVGVAAGCEVDACGSSPGRDLIFERIYGAAALAAGEAADDALVSAAAAARRASLDAEARLNAAEEAETRAAAEAARAAERVARRREAVEREEEERRRAHSEYMAALESQRDDKERKAKEAAREAGERVKARQEARRAAAKADVARRGDVERSMADNRERTAAAARAYAQEEEATNASEKEALADALAEALGEAERARQRERKAAAAQAAAATAEAAAAAAEAESSVLARWRARAEADARSNSPQVAEAKAAEKRAAADEWERHAAEAKAAKPRKAADQQERDAAELELSAALMMSADRPHDLALRLENAMRRARAAGVAADALRLGEEALARAAESVAAEEAAKAAAETARDVAERERSSRSGTPSPPLKAPSADGRAAEEAKDAREAEVSAEAAVRRAVEAAAGAEAARGDAESELRAAMRPGLLGAAQPARLNAALDAAREAGVAERLLRVAEEALPKVLPAAPADPSDVAAKLQRARTARAAQEERHVAAERADAAAWARAEAEAEGASAATPDLRSELLNQLGHRALSAARGGDGGGGMRIGVVAYPAEDIAKAPPAATPRSPPAVPSTRPPRLGSLTVERGRASDGGEVAALLRDVNVERARATAAERDIASTRHALASKVAEVEAMQREMRRLRNRAEVAERRLAAAGGGNPRRASTAGYESRRLSAANDPRRLANGAYSARPSAGVDDVQSAMADLQTRLRKSEERALKGEILVGKLRAFVAQQQPGPQPQPGDAVSWL